MGGRKKDGNERVVGCCWEDERKMGIAAAGTASDLTQSNARNDMGIWDMGDVSCVDALGGESDLGDWGGGDIKCVDSGA